MADAPALALVEFHGIAIGTRAADALVKKANVRLERIGTFQPGRFAIMFSGGVADVEESYVEALRVGAEALADRVLLPDVDRSVFGAAMGTATDWGGDCLGVIETTTLAAILEASDAAVKGADVCIVQMRLGDGLGGKGLAHFTGLQADIEAAIEIGASRARREDRMICTSIIPRLDEDVRAALQRGTRFREGGA